MNFNLNYSDYWTTKDIMTKLNVSENWIRQNIRPYINMEQQSETTECPYIVEEKHSTRYQKDNLYRYFVKNMKVYTRDYEHSTEQDRGEEIAIAMPDEVKQSILNGEFEFINMKKFQAIMGYKSRESVYRSLYRLRAYAIKLFGKTYYYIP